MNLIWKISYSNFGCLRTYALPSVLFPNDEYLVSNWHKYFLNQSVGLLNMIGITITTRPCFRKVLRHRNDPAMHVYLEQISHTFEKKNVHRFAFSSLEGCNRNQLSSTNIAVLLGYVLHAVLGGR